MSYRLGVDVGTAFTSAAVFEDGRVEVLPLAGTAARIPTVLFFRPDGELLVGRAAARRGLDEPDRVASGFPRRLGDPTAIIVAGSPYSAQTLLARLVSWVVARATELRGEPPAAVTLARPASWSPYTTELLLGALRQADLAGGPALDVRSAPEAAAAYHAHRTHAGPGEYVAVYDLGAGSFDTAVLVDDGGGFAVVGAPDGMERFGGLDLDEALLAHVARAAGVPIDVSSSRTDPGLAVGIARLRAECAEAKEILSEDTETTLAVGLAGVTTNITVTRARFEDLARPALTDTVKALRRALRSVPIEATGLSAVLLHGGCSRIPLVGALLAEELGAGVPVRPRPAEEIALGTALLSGLGADDAGPLYRTVVIGPPVPTSVPPSKGTPLPAPVPVPVPAVPVAAESAAADWAASEPVTAWAPGAAPEPAADADAELVGAGAAAAGGAGGGGGGAFSRAGDYVRRRPWVPAGIAAVLVPLVVLLLVLGGGSGKSPTAAPAPAAVGHIPAPAPAVLAKLESAENLVAKPAPQPTANSADDVRVGGSVEVAPITETAYALFRDQQKDVQVSVDAVNTDDGYQKLCKGEVDLTGASFPESPTATCGQNQVVSFEVAHETLPVVVDKSNTWAKCLTLTQLHTIFGQTGATSWNQVDPSFPNVPLSVYGPDRSSIPYAFFNASVNGGKDAGRTDYKGFGDGGAIASNISATRGAIGYLDFPSEEANGDRLRGVEVNSGSGCVYPTLVNAQNGQYLPLCKPLYIYVRRDSLRKPAVAAFVRFYLTNGAKIAEQAHYVPRDQSEIADSVSKVTDLTKGVAAVS